MTAALKECVSQLVGQKKAKDCADRADRAKLRVATERLAGIFKGVGLILTERDPDLTSVNHELGRPVLSLRLRASRNVFNTQIGPTMLKSRSILVLRTERATR